MRGGGLHIEVANNAVKGHPTPRDDTPMSLSGRRSKIGLTWRPDGWRVAVGDASSHHLLQALAKTGSEEPL